MANLHKLNPKEKYYPLDNSAVFIASITDKSSPFIYRVSCELDAPIYLPDMEKAFHIAIERFPWFKAELRSGVFWYYLDPIHRSPKLSADSKFPVEYHRLSKGGRFLLRVRIFASRIACEFHHVLTDGTGAIEFLKTLVASYLTLRGVKTTNWEGIIKPDSDIDVSEFEDAYAGRIRKKIPSPEKLPPAFHLPGKRYSGIIYRITTGTASVSESLKIAKNHGISLTELFTAIYLFALQSISESEGTNFSKPICVQVPVNLRRMYPSKTLRNFFLFVPITLDTRLGHYEIEEIIKIVHYTMRLKLNTKEMDRQIRRNVGSEKNIFARLFPLIPKNFMLRLIGRRISDPPFTGSISNLGQIILPDEFAERIKRFDFIPARNTLTGANIGIVSWKDKLSITIGSLILNRDLERIFFTSCVKLGIPVTVEANF
ncbi:MAG TPA: hypothetical protein PK771_07570 [Spirochaetota bacterium]|nr:hypothetical protein [Spirochaetota bacterium]